ncbi:MAG: Hsp20/alpha crystallin family protein, partial [Dehalococcoidales bacterium]|nr:Hsp20/alpha crystallin family protein [Dehalococcoidales bacterium]
RRSPEETLAWAPNIDLFEKGDKLVVRAEVPGIDKEDINISVTGDTLTLSGERKTEKETEEGDYYRSEMSYGKFTRSIVLPEYVDPEKIEATYDNGILEISMAKSEEAKAKKIEIKSKS